MAIVSFLDPGKGPYNFIGEIEAHEGKISVGQLASIHGESIDTIYRMVRNNEVPYTRTRGKNNGKIKFDPSTLGLHYRKLYPATAAALRDNPRYQRAA